MAEIHLAVNLETETALRKLQHLAAMLENVRDTIQSPLAVSGESAFPVRARKPEATGAAPLPEAKARAGAERDLYRTVSGVSPEPGVQEGLLREIASAIKEQTRLLKAASHKQHILIE